MATSPSYRAERIWEELQEFTLEELRWLHRKMLHIGEDPEPEEEGGGAGVREPRRPIRPRSGGMIFLEDEPDSDETQNFELTPEERSTA